MIVKYNKEIEISSLSTFKNPPNCPNYPRQSSSADHMVWQTQTIKSTEGGEGGVTYHHLSYWRQNYSIENKITLVYV